MRLIANINYTDDCTYNYTETLPIVYESAEAFIVEFERLVLKTVKEVKFPNSTHFKLGGQEWEAMYFYQGKDKVEFPEIYTLEEWYKRIENE